ncbi:MULTISPECIES: hypothetical protein [Rhodococcus]|uniref:hypothetical protein n=1 Tax=Rhodococcus TaxID=1827 RepID=UPI0020CC253B|nr:hypothetical protein [Rhodococcus gordoniae]UTT48515.1 hypothetical protein NMQ04_20220 [Rhodococcus gordoniae]
MADLRTICMSLSEERHAWRLHVLNVSQVTRHKERKMNESITETYDPSPGGFGPHRVLVCANRAIADRRCSRRQNLGMLTVPETICDDE